MKQLQKDAITYNNPLQEPNPDGIEDAPTLQGIPSLNDPEIPQQIKRFAQSDDIFPTGKPQVSDGGPNNPPWVAPQLGMMERKTIDNLDDYLAEGSE